jgi:hypothetical protein
VLVVQNLVPLYCVQVELPKDMPLTYPPPYGLKQASSKHILPIEAQ